MPSPRRPRILVTRSRLQASTLASELQALGADPILVPTISIAPPASYAALDAAIAQLHTFHWLLFTSVNAVESFAQRLELSGQPTAPPLQPDPNALADPPLSTSRLLRIAAIGPATAHALNAIGRPPNLLPPHAVAESLAQSLLPHITPGQTRMLLVRAETARDTLPDTLRAAGAHLLIAPAYRNVIPAESIPLLQSLFADPATWPDAITFTSSSTASNLLALLDAANLTLPAAPSSGHPEGHTILRASIGPITSQTLRDLGYPPHIQAATPDIPSLVQALAYHLHLSPG